MMPAVTAVEKERMADTYFSFFISPPFLSFPRVLYLAVNHGPKERRNKMPVITAPKGQVQDSMAGGEKISLSPATGNRMSIRRWNLLSSLS